MTERKRGLSTRAIHSPARPSGPGTPLVHPIVASTTFSFETAAEFGRVMSEEEYGFLYARLRNPTVEELNSVLAELEAADAEAWRRPARVRYVETMANPGFPVADLATIAATKGEGVFIVDNTFASPALCRPLEHGADLVCESATKYLNGHHDVTAGVVAGPRELVERARAHLVDTGGELDPYPALLLRRGLKKLPPPLQ